MSTGLIIAIVVVALILLVLFAFVLPRARRTAKVKARERELEQRRERVAGEHRAEAELREQRAQMHEQGRADHELIDESERDRFAGTSAMSNEPTDTRDDDRVKDRPMHEPDTEYEQGRVDEAREREGRFGRSPETPRTEDPSRRA